MIRRDEVFTHTVTYEAEWMDDLRAYGSDPAWVISASSDSDGGMWFTPNAQTGQDEELSLGIARMAPSADPDEVIRLWLRWWESGSESQIFEEI